MLWLQVAVQYSATVAYATARRAYLPNSDYGKPE
jgi:hypothetical protein